MVSTLVINVRCTCQEEYLLLQKIHRLYQEDAMRKRLLEKANNVDRRGVIKFEAEVLSNVGQAGA